MTQLGRAYIVIGAIVVLFGLALTFNDRLPFRFPRLSLDIRLQRDNFSLYIPNNPWPKSRGPRYGQTGLDSRRRLGDDATMHIHWEESATTKTAPFRRNPLGAGGPPTFQTEAAGAPQALSFVRHDVKTAPAASVIDLGGRSSLRACNRKTPARGPRDFCHGLL